MRYTVYVYVIIETALMNKPQNNGRNVLYILVKPSVSSTYNTATLPPLYHKTERFCPFSPIVHWLGLVYKSIELAFQNYS